MGWVRTVGARVSDPPYLVAHSLELAAKALVDQYNRYSRPGEPPADYRYDTMDRPWSAWTCKPVPKGDTAIVLVNSVECRDLWRYIYRPTDHPDTKKELWI